MVLSTRRVGLYETWKLQNQEVFGDQEVFMYVITIKETKKTAEPGTKAWRGLFHTCWEMKVKNLNEFMKTTASNNWNGLQ